MRLGAIRSAGRLGVRGRLSASGAAVSRKNALSCFSAVKVRIFCAFGVQHPHSPLGAVVQFADFIELD